MAGSPDDTPTPTPGDDAAEKTPPKRRRVRGRGRGRGRWRAVLLLLLVFILLLAVGRAMLPSAVRWYVNRTLDRAELYDGEIGGVTIHLYRGAYAIHDVRINKTVGDVPVPLFAAERVDLAVEWGALLSGKLVGRIEMFRPELNFVDDAPGSGEGGEASDQTGAGGPWLEMITDLFPFKINSAAVTQGSIHFRAFGGEQPVDVYLSQLEASVENLTNINDAVTPLVTTVEATALAMDEAPFEYEMKLDPFSYRPTFHLVTRLLNLDVTELNDLARAYGAFDFERGSFDLVVELDAKEGRLEGYVKPLFRDLKVLSLREDLDEGNVLQVFWEALVGGAEDLLKNQPRDQFGTLIPFTGDVTSPETDILAMIGNVLRNAFVRAYLPRLQGGEAASPGDAIGAPGSLEFGTPTLEDAMSIGEGG